MITKSSESHHINTPEQYAIESFADLGEINSLPTVSAVLVIVDKVNGLSSNQAKALASQKLVEAKEASRSWIIKNRAPVPQFVSRMWLGISNNPRKSIQDCVIYPGQPCTGNDPRICPPCTYSPDFAQIGETLNGRPFVIGESIRVRKPNRLSV